MNTLSSSNVFLNAWRGMISTVLSYPETFYFGDADLRLSPTDDEWRLDEWESHIDEFDDAWHS